MSRSCQRRNNGRLFFSGLKKRPRNATGIERYNRSINPTTKTWITVGPNGTEISTDDGKNWRPLKPSSYDPPDANKNWNILSLPFVVGPHGRIGKLNAKALAP